MTNFKLKSGSIKSNDKEYPLNKSWSYYFKDSLKFGRRHYTERQHKPSCFVWKRKNQQMLTPLKMMMIKNDSIANLLPTDGSDTVRQLVPVCQLGISIFPDTPPSGAPW